MSIHEKLDKLDQLARAVDELYGHPGGEGYLKSLLATYMDDTSIDWHLNRQLKILEERTPS